MILDLSNAKHPGPPNLQMPGPCEANVSCTIQSDDEMVKAIRKGDETALIRFTKRLRSQARQHLQKTTRHASNQVQWAIRRSWLARITPRNVRRICLSRSADNARVIAAWQFHYCELGLLRRISWKKFRGEQVRLVKDILTALSYENEAQLNRALDLKKALAKLAKHDRESCNTLMLKHMHGMTLTEIADQEDLSVQQVRTSLKRAVSFMRKYQARSALTSSL